jgi:hypothetical protein
MKIRCPIGNCCQRPCHHGSRYLPSVFPRATFSSGAQGDAFSRRDKSAAVEKHEIVLLASDGGSAARPKA